MKTVSQELSQLGKRDKTTEQSEEPGCELRTGHGAAGKNKSKFINWPIAKGFKHVEISFSERSEGFSPTQNVLLICYLLIPLKYSSMTAAFISHLKH